MSDEELMARLVAGDMAALGTLFERYRQPLFRFLYRMLQRAAWAEDVLQEAFLRVYDHRRRYTPGKAFSTWLYAIAYLLVAVDLRNYLKMTRSHLAGAVRAGRRWLSWHVCLHTLSKIRLASPEHPSAIWPRFLLK